MKEPSEIQKIEYAIAAQLRRLLPPEEDRRDGRISESHACDQNCRFCNDPKSILTKETCCTGCSKLVK